MRFRDYIDLAFTSVKTNKIRSSLSILGIVIGIGAIITVITIGKGGQKVIIQEMEKFGGRRVSLQKYSKHITLKTTSKPPPLTNQDLYALKKYCTHIELFAPILKSRAYARYLNINRIANLFAATETFKDFNNYTMLRGRFFTQEEINARRKVAVIGETFCNEVFGGTDAIGKTLEVNNSKYTIIGIIKKEGTFADSYYIDLFDFVILPLPIIQQQNRNKKLRQINMLVKSTNEMNSAKEEVFEILRKRYGDEADKHYAFFELRSTVQTINKVLDTAALVITLIAGISLIVGGLGIMNIMLIAVLERTREIGIQKALGATQNNILFLFLSESSVIGIFGGLIGIFTGIILCYLISIVTGIPIKITLGTIILAVLFSIAIGMFFGIFPAKKAAKLDPVDSLRYE